MNTDYVSIHDFRAFLGPEEGHKWSEPETDEAQLNVVDLLERWAGTAWPNVTSSLNGSITVSVDGHVLTLTEGETGELFVGQVIRIVGAGVDGGDLLTTIGEVTDTDHLVLYDPALTSVIDAALYVDGDGVAASARRAAWVTDGDKQVYVLPRSPVLSILSVTVGGMVIDPLQYFPTWESGELRFVGRAMGGFNAVEIVFTFGEMRTPGTVKRAVSKAMRSYLVSDEPSRIPENVRQYTADRTTIILGNDNPELQPEPWPWDKEASDLMYAYWGRRRPVGMVGV